MKRLFFRILILCLLAGLTGCAGFRPETDPALDKLARTRLTEIRSHNQEIAASKGMARVRMEQKENRQSFTMAWAAQAPNQARIILTFSGQPLETIIATGEKVQFRSHTGRHPLHTLNQADPDMEQLLGIPIRLSEFVALLLGRVPIPEHDDVWFQGQSPDPTSTPICLRENFTATHWTLTPDSQGRITRIQLKDADQKPLYTLERQAFRNVKTVSVPGRILFTGNEGQRLEITLSRFLPNAPVKESAFWLTPEGS